METSVLIGIAALGLIVCVLLLATIRRHILRHRRRRAALEEGEQIQSRLERLLSRLR